MLGERSSGSYRVTGTGHHIIPVELWEMFGFPDEAKKVFDEATIPVKSYIEDGITWKHDFTGHGPRNGYTAYVRDEIVDYIKSKGLSGKKLSANQYVELAQSIRNCILSSSNEFISGYLSNVSDPKKLRKWYTTTGIKLPKPIGLSARKLAGFKKFKVPRGIKCGRKIPIVKYAMLVGVAYLWEADYNNARADGYGPAAAGAIATARAADPGIEMSFDFGYMVGSIPQQARDFYREQGFNDPGFLGTVLE